jgi:hypothetical protein
MIEFPVMNIWEWILFIITLILILLAIFQWLIRDNWFL